MYAVTIQRWPFAILIARHLLRDFARIKGNSYKGSSVATQYLDIAMTWSSRTSMQCFCPFFSPMSSLLQYSAPHGQPSLQEQS